MTSEYTDGMDVSDVEDLDNFDIATEARDRLLGELTEQKEQRLRMEIRETDWEECRSLDVIFVTMVSEVIHSDLDHPPVPTYAVKVFRNKAIEPDVEKYYEVYDGPTEVCRVTEEDCHLVGIDPETGQDKE